MALETWEEQLRRGGLDLAILLTIRSANAYGLQIIRHLEEVTNLIVTEGTVYPILARLTRDGLLEATWNSTEGPHPRKYYRLTKRGRDTLSQMVKHWTEFSDKISRLIEATRS